MHLLHVKLTAMGDVWELGVKKGCSLACTGVVSSLAMLEVWLLRKAGATMCIRTTGTVHVVREGCNPATNHHRLITIMMPPPPLNILPSNAHHQPGPRPSSINQTAVWYTHRSVCYGRLRAGLRATCTLHWPRVSW